MTPKCLTPNSPNIVHLKSGTLWVTIQRVKNAQDIFVTHAGCAAHHVPNPG